MTSTMFKDHRPHVIGLGEIESRNLTIEKLALFKEVPKCHMHSEKLSELCCKTCHYVPICMACGIFGRHKGHDLYEVNALAESERAGLVNKLSTLTRYKDSIYEMKEKLTKAKQILESSVIENDAQLRREYEKKKSETFRKLMSVDDEFEAGDISNHSPATSQSRQKYQEICDEERKYIEQARNDLKEDQEVQKRQLSCKLENSEKEFEKLSTSVQTQRRENHENMDALSDHLDNIIKRYENAAATAASILTTKHDWTDVQCIPDICSALDLLTVEMRKDFPKLDSLSAITLNQLAPLSEGSRLDTPFEKLVSVIDVTEMKVNGWNINSLSGSPKQDVMVVTGEATAYNSHLCIVDITSNIRGKSTFSSQSFCAWRYCTFLSEFTVATVADPGEIGIYDIRDRSYTKKNISDVIAKCPPSQRVTCVTTDAAQNCIFVGTNSRDVYVFDDQLNLRHTITLPDVIRAPINITYKKDNLLVCDVSGKTAYAITMHGQRCKQMYKFSQPDFDGGDWSHRSLCVDRRGFIYMLWSARISGLRKRLLVKYNKDGGHILKAALVDGDRSSIATVDTDDGEKLIVASYSGGSLLVYGLNLITPVSMATPNWKAGQPYAGLGRRGEATCAFYNYHLYLNGEWLSRYTSQMLHKLHGNTSQVTMFCTSDKEKCMASHMGQSPHNISSY
ncbi:Tripartite motif-containing protein 3 [Apostichopus japonicus]|uniref:Tripartite motif-containing protein 3 n=1 Tax=Stichopus japonicus TaxID=307972 RepID=A0A2G8K9T8_STIJA|nr:Tripartite motif-containing protein 3 [Apostichopus japonicus]